MCALVLSSWRESGVDVIWMAVMAVLWMDGEHSI